MAAVLSVLCAEHGECTCSRVFPLPRYMCTPHGRHMYLGNGKGSTGADPLFGARHGIRTAAMDDSKHASESRRSRPSSNRGRRSPIRRPARQCLGARRGPARPLRRGARPPRARGWSIPPRSRTTSSSRISSRSTDPPGAGRGPRARRARRGPAVSRWPESFRAGVGGVRGARRRPAPPRRELRWVSLVRDDAHAHP